MSVVLPPNPLSYEGQTALPYISKPFAPPSGYTQAPVPCLWNDTSGRDAYVQTSPGVWVPIGGFPGQINTLTGNTGGAISPDSDQNIDLLGSASTGMTVVGTTNTLTFQTTFATFDNTTLGFKFPGGGSNVIQYVTSGNVSLPLGNLSVSRAAVGSAVSISASNTDNTAASASSCALNLSVAGTTQIGDPYVLLSAGSARSYSFGIDTSDTQMLKLTTSASGSVTPSSGTSLAVIDPGVLITFPSTDLAVNRTTAGGLVKISIRNIDNTIDTSSARLEIVAGNSGGTTGDAYILFSNLSVPFNYEMGQETSDNSFVLKYNCALGTPNLTGDPALTLSTVGLLTVNQNTIGLAIGLAGPTITSGSGAPSASQPKGSLYLRTDGSGTNDRAYIATNSSGTWTAIVTVA